MRAGTVLFLFFFAVPSALFAQSLDFLGLKGISFGMNVTDFHGGTLIIDSTSVYKDSAQYIANTRCQVYYRKTDSPGLQGFTASQLQYEFCNGELAYVFINVNGKTEIDHAITSLQKTFRHIGCGKKTPPEQCKLIDTSAKGMRLIITIDQAKEEMKLVIVPKKGER